MQNIRKSLLGMMSDELSFPGGARAACDGPHEGGYLRKVGWQERRKGEQEQLKQIGILLFVTKTWPHIART